MGNWAFILNWVYNLSFPIARSIAAEALVRAFALEAGRLGSILSRVKPKTLKLVCAVTLAKRSALCSAEDEMNREYNTPVNS